MNGSNSNSFNNFNETASIAIDDELESLLSEMRKEWITFTYKDLVDNHSEPCFNYFKYNIYKKDGKPLPIPSKAKRTGKRLLINQCKNLAIIDVDIKHNLSEERKSEIRESFLNVIDNLDGVIAIKSCHGGIKFYCLLNGWIDADDSINESGRYVKAFESDEFDIDILVCLGTDKDSGDTCAGSIVCETDESNKPIFNQLLPKYEFVKGNENTTIDTSLSMLLRLFKKAKLFKINKRKCFKPDEYELSLSKSTTKLASKHILDISEESIITLINGFKGVKIHSNSANRTIKDEITLWVLFQALNDLPDSIRDYAYEFIHTNADFSGTNALRDWDTLKDKYEDASSDWHYIYGMIKAHNPIYFNEHIKSLLKRKCEVIQVYKAELEPINTDDIDKLTSFDERIKLIAKGIRYLPNLKGCYLDFVGRTNIEMITKEEFRCKIEGLFDNSRDINEAIHKLRPMTRSNIEQITFDKIFTGWAHPSIQNDSYSKHSALYKELILDNLCSGDEVAFKYFMLRSAYILLHPGKQCKKELIIYGRQGTGKSTYAKIFATIIGFKYANDNAYEENITGNFNSAIFMMSYLAINEAKAINLNKANDSEKMKFTITEDTIDINKKCVPQFKAQNTVNIDKLSNNKLSQLLGVDSRREFVIETSSKHRGDNEYWAKFYDAMDEPGFFSNVRYYIESFELDAIKADAKYNFLKLPVPSTDAKRDMIKASLFGVDRFIFDNWMLVSQKSFNETDFNSAFAEGNYKMNQSTMYEELIKRCDHFKKTIDGHRYWRYLLKVDEQKAFMDLDIEAITKRKEQDKNDLGEEITEEEIEDEADKVSDFIKDFVLEHHTKKTHFKYVAVDVVNAISDGTLRLAIIDKLLEDGFTLTKIKLINARGYRKDIKD